jgi:hypothetical protein
MVNAVSLKLNVFDLSPQTPVVLKMMLKLVGPKLVPHLDDLVVSIFSILDGFHEYERLCEELFLVLGIIVEESSKGDPDVKLIEAAGPAERWSQPGGDQTQDFLNITSLSNFSNNPWKRTAYG